METPVYDHVVVVNIVTIGYATSPMSTTYETVNFRADEAGALKAIQEFVAETHPEIPAEELALMREYEDEDDGWHIFLLKEPVRPPTPFEASLPYTRSLFDLAPKDDENEPLAPPTELDTRPDC